MINVEFIPVKYITGSYRYEEKYPDAQDLLWDIVSLGKKTISVESIDWIENDKKEKLILELLENNYIKKNNNKISVIKTDWDGRCD